MTTRALAILCLAPLLTPACVMTSTETRTWSDPGDQQAYERHGWVDSVRETVQRQQGNPAAGAVAGAIIGGLIGSTLGGHTHYDRWGNAHYAGDGTGAVVGAVGGAAVGAAASSGSAEARWYEVNVRFDDGGYETFTYRGGSPFRPGDMVILGARGLSLAQ
jgi:outer membrane lipoprotein SlyB